MSNFLPKPGGIKVGGLSRKAQKLQAALEKASNAKTGAKPLATANNTAIKAKTSSFTGKKTSFQRKAV